MKNTVMLFKAKFHTVGVYFLIPSLILNAFESDISSEERINSLVFAAALLYVLLGVLLNADDWFVKNNIS